MSEVIPELMGIFEAKRWAQKGFNVRRSIWVEPVESGIVPFTSGKRVTQWLAYALNVWFLRLTDGTPPRVVEEADFDVDDLRALDYTVRDENWVEPPLEPIPPIDPVDPLPPLPPLPVPRPIVPPGGGGGGSGGGSGGSGGTGGGGGGGGSSGGGDGVSGGGGGSGGSGGGTGSGGRGGQRRPNRQPPTIDVTVNRVTPQECVPRDMGGSEVTDPISDDFTVVVTMGADSSYRLGEVWFLKIECKGIRYTGTITPTDTTSTAFTVHGVPPTTDVPVIVTAYLAGVGVTAKGTGTATMRGHCAPGVLGCTDMLANNYDPDATQDDGSCTYDPPPVSGCTDPAATNYNSDAEIDDGSCTYPPPLVYGCTISSAYNYNPAANIDDGSCVLSCEAGHHWDEGMQSCVPDE